MEKIKNILPNLDSIVLLTALSTILVLGFKSSYNNYYGIPKIYIDLDFNSFGYVSVLLIISLSLTGFLPLLISFFDTKVKVGVTFKSILVISFIICSVYFGYQKLYLLSFLVGMAVPPFLTSFIKMEIRFISSKLTIVNAIFIYLLAMSCGLGWITAKEEKEQYVIESNGIENFDFVVLGIYKDNYIVSPIEFESKNVYQLKKEYSLLNMVSENTKEPLALKKVTIELKVNN
jgi:hypothetical protein